MIPARRLLTESKEESATGWPDGLGALLLALGIGALALGVVKGAEWQWGSPAVLGSFAAAVVLLGLFTVRSATHRAPVIDLSMFRVRSFAVANAGTFVFGLGFFALLLCNVLFLTTVWHYEILLAGVALTPGPIMAAVMAPLAGRLADRYGPRAIALPGNLLFGAGPLLLALNVEATPQYWSVYFPAIVLGGMGIGLSLPAFGSAAVAELPRPRFATGIAIVSCARQVGAVVGIAALVAVIGTPPPDQVVDAFHRVWLLVAAAGLLAAAVSIALGRVRAHDPGTVPSAR